MWSKLITWGRTWFPVPISYRFPKNAKVKFNNLAFIFQTVYRPFNICLLVVSGGIYVKYMSQNIMIPKYSLGNPFLDPYEIET